MLIKALCDVSRKKLCGFGRSLLDACLKVDLSNKILLLSVLLSSELIWSAVQCTSMWVEVVLVHILP